MQELTIQEKLALIERAMDNKRGEAIEVIDISSKTAIADYFVICSASSTTQAEAIADEIEYKMEDAGYEVRAIDGKNSSRWILMDYGDIIVHVFHQEERAFYNLERLWKESNISEE